jgi:hypothetical protein
MSGAPTRAREGGAVSGARRALRGRVAAVLARRRVPAPRVRLSGPGSEPRTLAPGDPAATALAVAAEAVLSAAQRASRE